MSPNCSHATCTSGSTTPDSVLYSPEEVCRGGAGAVTGDGVGVTDGRKEGRTHWHTAPHRGSQHPRQPLTLTWQGGDSGTRIRAMMQVTGGAPCECQVARRRAARPQQSGHVVMGCGHRRRCCKVATANPSCKGEEHGRWTVELPLWHPRSVVRKVVHREAHGVIGGGLQGGVGGGGGGRWFSGSR